MRSLSRTLDAEWMSAEARPSTLWSRSTSLRRIAKVVGFALAHGLLADKRSIVFHDLTRAVGRFAELGARFPENTLHAVAVKANPLVRLLWHLVANGAGLEAASIEEAHLALAAGCRPNRIVFDSPAKTAEELVWAISKSIWLNVDNLDELERIDALGIAPTAPVGLRINPQVSTGSIAATSVAGKCSKFGVPVEDSTAILEAFRRYPWLNGLQVHVGSQGCGLDLLCAGVARMVQVRDRIEHQLGAGRVTALDIGGGLPWDYSGHAEAPDPQTYVSALRQTAPRLFAGEARLATEFGRALLAGDGWAISRVEYVKNLYGHCLAVIHLGADFLFRDVYCPQDWQHRFSLLDPDGRLRQRAPIKVSIAGPLCFGDDFLAREIALPPPRPGDWIVIHDVGAYALGMWSRHCNRGLPPCIGYHNDGLGGFETLFSGERPEDVVRFWDR